MTLRTAKASLSILWILAIPLLLFTLIRRQLNGYYGTDPTAVWTWVAQFVLPGLGLILGAWSLKATPADDDTLRNQIVFWGAAVLSLLYLAALYYVVASQAWLDQDWGEVFKQSALFLSLIQATVIGLLGKFFVQSGS
jgi:hypothetical protein